MNKNSFRYNNTIRRKPMSEINVTPFVDVMLVLLIVFMITAPLMKTVIDIELPKVNTPNIPDTNDPLIVSINQNKEIFLSDTKVQPNQLTPKLLEIKKANPKIKVFLKADKMVSYEILMQVMKQIIDSNINNVSLMTNPKD